MLAAGTDLGRYKIVAPLGAGGMGEVYRARDTRLDREVAIKVLPESFARDPDRLARFEREARAVAALSHPNIVAIYDYGTEQGTSFAVIELLQGVTLRGRLAGAALSWREALEIGAAVADGLAAAHAKGIIHRDIKPENLFLVASPVASAPGVVKILDFGLARVEVPVSSDVETRLSLPGQTDPGMVVGTMGYMSPEQLRGQKVDARTDLFSLGCVLYELVAGRHPFRGHTGADTAAAILHDEPSRLSNFGSDAPPEVERIICQCLVKGAEQRFPSARDLAVALRALLSGSGVPEPPPPTTVFQRKPPRRRREALSSLAILPLFNASNDPDLEYLSDGITESIISTLSQLPKLRVMARSTVFRFKGRDVDACAVGRELKVRAVLTGRVLQRGERLILRAELVDTADGAQLWGEQYNRPLADLLAVEEEMAREIVDRLRLRLSGPQRRRLDKRPTIDTEAYQLYLRGRFYWYQFTEESIRKAIECFRQALARDPDYALAYAGLGDAYFALSDHYLPPSEVLPLAREAARKALVLDPTLAETLTSLAIAQLFLDLDWEAAEKMLQRALELNPNYALAHSMYGVVLVLRGRSKEALGFLERAAQLDPLNVALAIDLGLPDYVARRHDLAIVKLQKAKVLDPNSHMVQQVLGWNYLHLGDYNTALAAFQKARQQENRPDIISGLVATYARAGQRAEALQTVEDLHTMAKRCYVAPWCFAMVYAALDDHEEALAWLQKAYDARSTHLIWLNLEPLCDGLRSDPRFQALQRKLGLPASETPDDRPIDSLAILPLVNAAGDPDMEFLSDGITESLIYQLGRLPRLRVMSRNSAFRFKGKDVDVRKAGRSLGVQAVLTGRVLARGDTLAISVELMDVRDDMHVWGERYNRKSVDILSVEAEIVGDIFENLRLRLTGDDRRQLARRYTDNSEAYQLYLCGRFYWHQYTEETTLKAIECFRQAIAKDPAYALAFAGLADCYAVLGAYDWPPKEAFPEAKKALKRALDLDDRLAEVHVSLGWVLMCYDRECLTAEREFQLALRLNPNLSEAHRGYGWYCALVGRVDEGITALERAKELDPLAPTCTCDLACFCFWVGKSDRAWAELQRTLEIDPNFLFAYLFLGLFAALAGNYTEAIAALEKALGLAKDNPDATAMLGFVHGLAGNHHEAQAALEQLHAYAGRRYVHPSLFAWVHTALGEKDEAFRWLRKANEDRAASLIYLRFDPIFDNLRSDPRFQALLRDVGFPGTKTTD